MTKRWMDTEGDAEARGRAVEFSARMREDLDGGLFWTERIKVLRGDPAKRLAFALDLLPLPAAFSEAAVAARTLIRAKRKGKEPFNEELSLLYWLAALYSFMLDYALRLREPGFNVVEAIPGNRLKSLRYTYAQLGYRHLSLLNKVDIRWLTEAWGEPESHSTLNAMHRSLWDEYETKLIEDRKHASEAFLAKLGKPAPELRQGGEPEPEA